MSTPADTMRFLFLGLNFAPEHIGTAVYSTGLCEELVARGHDVSAIVAKPYYPQWQTWPQHRRTSWRSSRENGVKVLRCPTYIPANPTGVRRIVHYLSFALSSSVPLLWRAIKDRPDIVVLVAPSIVPGPVAWLASRLAGGTCWLHVQDFEVGAAFATGLIKSNGIGARLARRFERLVVSLFDRTSSISPEMCRRLEALGVPSPRVHQFRNWANTERVFPSTEPSPILNEWNITAKHVALYSGNLGNKQGLDILIEAARILSNRDDLVFVICGDGSYRVNLEAQGAGLPNVVFKPLQPIERLNDLLGMATVHLLPQKADAADHVLPSKLTNMLASGRPVVATAAPDTGLAREVQGCGIVTAPGDAVSFAAAIEKLIDSPTLHSAAAAAARNRAEQSWGREAIFDRLCRWLEADLDSKSAAMVSATGSQRQ